MDTGIWTAYEAAAATGGMLCAKGEANHRDDDIWPEEAWAATGLSIDTRTLRPGDIFVALKEARDGHDFIKAAFEKGASAALVSHAPSSAPVNAPLLVVSDTMSGLRALAEAARDRCFGQLIGVTGSAGKTSTKEMLRAALGGCGKVHAADKSFNNHFGVPLTLAALPSDADFGVFEIGMNHAGEITPLTKLVKPHVAIITTVAAAHIEFFNTVEEIAHAKAEIISGLRKNGTAILPIDNQYFSVLKTSAQAKGDVNILTFGENGDADFRLLEYTETESGKAKISTSLLGQRKSFHLGVLGKHHALNAMAVLAAVHASGGNVAAAIEGLENFTPVAGRGARHSLTLSGKKITLIDEAYNANPASMAAAFSVLAGTMPKNNGRRIALLGEMKELGASSAQMHLDLAGLIEQAKVDLVFCAGEQLQPMYANLPQSKQGGYAAAASELEHAVKTQIHDGDIILAKGSNGSRVWALVEALVNTDNKN